MTTRMNVAAGPSRASRHLPWIVLAASILYSLSLQLAVARDTYFGDAGLKALLARQFAQGDLHLDLRLPAAPWVQRIWDQGLFPYTEPFVYDIGGRRFIRFPFVFPLLSAPFLRLLGYRGLFVLPLLGAWLTWAAFLHFCRRLAVHPAIQVVALLGLVLASPLTLYSATVWEHTLAVGLAFTGTVLVWSRFDDERVGNRVAAWGGIAVGLSVWLREEHLLLGALLAAAGCLATLSGRGPFRSRAALAVFVTATGVVVGLFLGVNEIVYGHPLGVHGLYTIEHLPTAGWRAGIAALTSTLRALLTYNPLVAVLPLALVVGRGRTVWLRRALVVVTLLFVLAVPLVSRHGSGKQWGARYLLVVAPLSACVAALALETLRTRERRWLLLSGSVVFGAVSLFGAYPNLHVALVHQPQANERRRSVVEAIRQDPTTAVALSHQYLTQQLAGLVGEKALFLTPRGKDLRLLAASLIRRGDTRFLFLCEPTYGCGPLTERTSEYTFRGGDGSVIARLRRIALAQRYAAFEAQLGPGDERPASSAPPELAAPPLSVEGPE